MKVRYVLIGLTAIALTAFLMTKSDPPKKIAVVPTAEKDPAVKQRVLAFNLEGFTQKGTKSWEVRGESAEAISESEIRLDNIIATAYGEEADAVITADKGIYNRTKNNVTLQKNVKATIANTQTFQGETLGIPTGAAGDGKSKAKTADSSKKSRIIITCDGAVEFNYEKNQAYFTKNVKVVSSDGNIDADKITMNLDKDTKKLKDIVADGNVKITRGENVTYSDSAMYVESEKKIVLTGKPKLVIYQQGEFETGLFGGK